MWGLFKSSEERVLDRILDTCDDTIVVYQTPEGTMPARRPSGVVRQVVKELRADGMSPIDVIQIIMLVLDLIKEIGPLVQEILDRIRNRANADPLA